MASSFWLVLLQPLDLRKEQCVLCLFVCFGLLWIVVSVSDSWIPVFFYPHP